MDMRKRIIENDLEISVMGFECIGVDLFLVGMKCLYLGQEESEFFSYYYPINWVRITGLHK